MCVRQTVGDLTPHCRLFNEQCGQLLLTFQHQARHLTAVQWCMKRENALQVGKLLALDLLLFVWRSLPIVGRFAAPVSHYVSMARVMGPRQAAAMSLLGLWAPAEVWVFHFMRLWRTSRVCSVPCSPTHVQPVYVETGHALAAGDEFIRARFSYLIFYRSPAA